MSKHNTPSRPADAGRPASLEAALSQEAREDGDSDERVVRRADTDGRGDRGISEDVERVGDDGLMSDAEYEALIRNEFEQTALPKPPALPGWHLCWLTTTSQYDNIAKRQRIGYRPVSRSEMPGFDPSNGQDLERFQGFVTCNEMVLHKIPEAYYQKMMAYFHHKRPAEDEMATLEKARGDNLDESVRQDSQGQDLAETLGAGFIEMERSAKKVARRPSFS